MKFPGIYQYLESNHCRRSCSVAEYSGFVVYESPCIIRTTTVERDMQQPQWRGRICTEFQSDRKGTDLLWDLIVGWRILLKWTKKAWGFGPDWTGSSSVHWRVFSGTVVNIRVEINCCVLSRTEQVLAPRSSKKCYSVTSVTCYTLGRVLRLRIADPAYRPI